MNVRKFLASSSRDAWRMVRDALGPDAVILSNRTVDGQVEILALPMEYMASLAEPAADKDSAPDSTDLSPSTATSASAALHEKRALSETTMAAFSATKQRLDSERPEGAAASAFQKSAQASIFAKFQPPTAKLFPPKRTVQEEKATPKAPLASELAEVVSEIRTEFMTEIRSMRGMLEEQLSEIAWTGHQKREPNKTLVLREMLAAGFSASLARYLAENLPANEKSEGGMSWIKSVLARNIAVMDNESEMLEKGGVFALVGPTGVGKTTTTAKLAARCVMRHGAGKLALITTDGYRIGAYEQLRIYGKILGVMVHSVKDETDLRIALDELKSKHTILIDTVGMGQRDKMVADQVAMLSGAGSEVKRLLCLSATSTGETLNEVVRSYTGDGLAGCIVTKLDEAATIGNVLDVIIRRKLNVYYVANGQRVPEDLHMPNQHYLIDRAFKLKREAAAFQLQDDELPLVVANAVRGMNDKSLRGVSLG